MDPFGMQVELLFRYILFLTFSRRKEGRKIFELFLKRFVTKQVLLFGVMAIEIKRKAPYAHTVCEIVKARFVMETPKMKITLLYP